MTSKRACVRAYPKESREHIAALGHGRPTSGIPLPPLLGGEYEASRPTTAPDATEAEDDLLGRPDALTCGDLVQVLNK